MIFMLIGLRLLKKVCILFLILGLNERLLMKVVKGGMVGSGSFLCWIGVLVNVV